MAGNTTEWTSTSSDGFARYLSSLVPPRPVPSAFATPFLSSHDDICGQENGLSTSGSKKTLVRTLVDAAAESPTSSPRRSSSPGQGLDTVRRWLNHQTWPLATFPRSSWQGAVLFIGRVAARTGGRGAGWYRAAAAGQREIRCDDYAAATCSVRRVLAGYDWFARRPDRASDTLRCRNQRLAGK